MYFVGLINELNYRYTLVCWRKSLHISTSILGFESLVYNCLQEETKQLKPKKSHFLQNFSRLAVIDETVPWQRQNTVSFQISLYRLSPFVFIQWNAKQYFKQAKIVFFEICPHSLSLTSHFMLYVTLTKTITPFVELFCRQAKCD